MNSNGCIDAEGPIETVNNILSMVPGGKANKSRAASTARVLINSNIGTGDISIRTAKFSQIRVSSDVVWEVGYQNRIRVRYVKTPNLNWKFMIGFISTTTRYKIVETFIV